MLLPSVWWPNVNIYPKSLRQAWIVKEVIFARRIHSWKLFHNGFIWKPWLEQQIFSRNAIFISWPLFFALATWTTKMEQLHTLTLFSLTLIVEKKSRLRQNPRKKWKWKSSSKRRTKMKNWMDRFMVFVRDYPIFAVRRWKLFFTGTYFTWLSIVLNKKWAKSYGFPFLQVKKSLLDCFTSQNCLLE